MSRPVSMNRNSGRWTTDGLPPRDGFEDAPAPAPIKENGQHEAYWILSGEERAKGFVRPLRHSYQHFGPEGPTYALFDLTEEQHERYDKYAYVKYEPYTDAEFPVTGRFWTQEQLDNIGKGCMTITSMSKDIAETYARQPNFYGATFCFGCNTHLPVGEFVWAGTTERVGS